MKESEAIIGKFTIFFSLRSFQTGSVTHPDSMSVGTVVCCMGDKRAGREVGHSPPNSAQVNNVYS